MLNWLENICSGNKTLWFKVNILPSDIENNCLSWIKVLRKGASFVMIQYSESLVKSNRQALDGRRSVIGRVVPEKCFDQLPFSTMNITPKE